MILKEETFRTFGYYPNDLKPHSNLRIVVACDDCGKIREIQKNAYYSLCFPCAMKKRDTKGEKAPMYGKHHSEETKKRIADSQKGKVVPKEVGRKISEAHKGKKLSEEHKRKISEGNKDKHHTSPSLETRKKISNTIKGSRHSEETKRKMSKSRRGKKHPMYGKHHTEETKEKIRKARKSQNFPRHRTKPEILFEEICKKNCLPFKYTGNGDVWIHNINPDFVDCNGKKVAVEIFSYWHNPLLRRNIPYLSTYEGRKKTLKEYGWKLVVFWQEDLERDDAEAFVLNTLKHSSIVS